MPAMAFAAEGDAPVGDAAATELKGADVTTDDTTAAIHYDTFDEAFEKTNDSANREKHAVITLNEDAALNPGSGFLFETDMTIDLNGHKLDTTLVDGKNDLSKYCVKKVYENNVLTKVLVNVHKGATVYDWTEDTTKADPSTGRWYVSGITTTCDACGTAPTDPVVEKNPVDIEATSNWSWQGTRSVSAHIYRTVYDDVKTSSTYDYYLFEEQTVAGTETRTWSSGWHYSYDWNDFEDVTAVTVLDKRAANTPEKAFVIAESADFVRVNGRIQHKDGLPEVTAKVKNTATDEIVDGTVAVTAATDAELAEYNKGKSEADQLHNAEATCTKEAVVIYKAVVTDPNGDVVETSYLKDDQAAPKTDHQKGKLAGVELLVKNGQLVEGEIQGFASEAGSSRCKEGRCKGS
jgi:hypothetical protein